MCLLLAWAIGSFSTAWSAWEIPRALARQGLSMSETNQMAPDFLEQERMKRSRIDIARSALSLHIEKLRDQKKPESD